MTRHSRQSTRAYFLGSVSAFLMAAGSEAVYAADTESSTNDDILLVEEEALQAQQTQASAQAVDVPSELEEIVVTGSRIQRSPLEAVSPVVSLDSAEIDQRGILRVEDLLKTLPQVIGAQSGARTHRTSGTATVDLRGLGSTRTLVLKDGKRLPIGSPQTAPEAVGADLNQIPSQLVDRVEVLTGGASSVYGADAVAGVVNFIMKKDYEGLEFDVQGSFFQSGNDSSIATPVLRDFGRVPPEGDVSGRTVDINVVMGTNFAENRGNVTAWFTYANDNPVKQIDRAISACAFGTRNQGQDFSCAGSTNSFPGRFSDIGLADDPDDSFTLTLDPQGTDGKGGGEDGITGLRNFDVERDLFDFAKDGFFQRSRERFTFGSSSHYEFADNQEFFLDLSFLRNETRSEFAPPPSLSRIPSVNCDNPLLSEAQLATFCADSNTFIDATGVERANLVIDRRFLEFGPRQLNFENELFRVVGGIRGEIVEGIDYELFGQFSTASANNLRDGMDVNKVNQAVDVILDTDESSPTFGQPVCRDQSGGCVPLDLFSFNIDGTSNVTEEAIDFTRIPLVTLGNTKQTVIGGNVAADLTRFGVKSPFADSGLQAVFGFEYRRDQAHSQPDIASLEPLGISIGRPPAPVDGRVEVYEFFGELQAPIIENAPLIQELSMNAAWRFSDFTKTTGTNGTFTIGGAWAPSSDIRARGQFARAVRAPNPLELFTPQRNDLFALSAGENDLFDPCAGDFNPNTPTPEPQRSFEECARTGVTQAQFGGVPDIATGQFNQLLGGNPDLETEAADTWTAGAVITPRFIPGLVLSIDWFSIEVDRKIGVIPPQLSLEGCLDTGAPVLCDNINRGAGGNLFIEAEANVAAINLNTGSLTTRGVDLDASYEFALDDVGIDNAGALNFRLVGSWLDKFVEEPLPGALQELVAPVDRKFNCAGKFGGRCGRLRPEFRSRLVSTWNSPWGLDVTMTWRYFDSVHFFEADNPAPVDEKLSSTSFFDFQAQYAITQNIELRMGVNNFLDKDPPLASHGATDFFGEGNTFPSTFDSLGRFIFTGMNVQF